MRDLQDKGHVSNQLDPLDYSTPVDQADRDCLGEDLLGLNGMIVREVTREGVFLIPAAFSFDLHSGIRKNALGEYTEFFPISTSPEEHSFCTVVESVICPNGDLRLYAFIVPEDEQLADLTDYAWWVDVVVPAGDWSVPEQWCHIRYKDATWIVWTLPGALYLYEPQIDRPIRLGPYADQAAFPPDQLIRAERAPVLEMPSGRTGVLPGLKGEGLDEPIRMWSSNRRRPMHELSNKELRELAGELWDQAGLDQLERENPELYRIFMRGLRFRLKLLLRRRAEAEWLTEAMELYTSVVSEVVEELLGKNNVNFGMRVLQELLKHRLHASETSNE